MPILKNARHELFAQERARGKTVDQAYQEAGYKENRGNAARLNADQSVKARVAELVGRAAVRAEIDAAGIIAKLAHAYDKAEGLDQTPTMVSAALGMARVAGLLSDKVEHSGRIEHEDMSDTEAVRRIAYMLAGDQARPGKPDKLDS